MKLFIIFSKLKAKILNASMEKGIFFLSSISKKRITFLLVLNFFIGSIILIYTKTIDYFFSHLICLTLNIIITLLIGREYVHTILFLDKEILRNYSHENIELKSNYVQFRKKAFHILNLSLCIIVLITFFWGIFSQYYIKLDVVGCYAIFIVSITVSISVIGYTEYLWLLWFLYRISKCTFMPYNKFIPAYTPFLIEIGTLTKHAKWCFFCEGFLYVYEYFVLIPNGNVTLSSINMPDKISFLVTWGVIFVVIILAFPVIIIIQEHLLSKIINNLKEQRIKTLSYPLDTLAPNNLQQFPEVYMCSWLINNLITSPDYPVKIQRLGPAIVSVATFILHIVSLLNQYPEFKKILINWFC